MLKALVALAAQLLLNRNLKILMQRPRVVGSRLLRV
jgi:hypothetical protein